MAAGITTGSGETEVDAGGDTIWGRQTDETLRGDDWIVGGNGGGSIMIEKVGLAVSIRRGPQTVNRGT